MLKASNRVLSLVLAGSVIGLVGCVGFPGGVTTTSPVTGTGALDFGVSGSGYQVASLEAAAAPEKPTYSSVMFVPDEIKVHYAGPLTAEEQKAEPADIEGAEAPVIDEAAAQAAEASASPIPSDGWITFKVKDAMAAIDLVKLSGATNAISFGNTPLPAGKYDQIRIVAGKPGAPSEQNPLSWSAADETSGKYFLPSNRLHINQGFEVREGYKTDLKFTFDAQTAMTLRPGMDPILKPASVKVFADYVKIVEASPSPAPTQAPAAQ